MKWWLIIIGSLFVVALAVVLVVFLYLQRTLTVSDQQPPSEDKGIPPKVSDPAYTPEPTAQESLATDSSDIPKANPVAGDSDTGFPLAKIPLSDEVKSALPLLGIEYETFYVTPAMISCAKTALGEARMEAIVGGEQPTWREMITLRSCL